MEYYLMRKNEVVTLCNLTDDGIMIDFSPNYRNPELAPLEHAAAKDHIKKWWSNRQVPISQGHIAKMLESKGIAAPSQYLLNNLGLSLTDYYWMRPLNSDLKWQDINLFENDFRDNLLMDGSRSSKSIVSLTPNSSLKGELEKTWVIKNGKRILIKGNRGRTSRESINEVVASRFHKIQGYNNHTEYKLVHIKGKPYDYGCESPAFTSDKLELVSAYALLTSEKRPDKMPAFEFLIELAGNHGINVTEFRRDLEYQILSDYILTNVDRHMENIGILRDAETLEFIRMAPIFDTGKAFGGAAVIPYTDEEIANIEINSFASTESELLSFVSDYSLIDYDKMLETDTIEDLYSQDSQTPKTTVKHMLRLYEKKIEMLKSYG